MLCVSCPAVECGGRSSLEGPEWRLVQQIMMMMLYSSGGGTAQACLVNMVAAQCWVRVSKNLNIAAIFRFFDMQLLYCQALMIKA